MAISAKDVMALRKKSGLGMMECKECGCCAYVCPAGRRIVHLVKFGKAEVNRRRRQQAKKG